MRAGYRAALCLAGCIVAGWPVSAPADHGPQVVAASSRIAAADTFPASPSAPGGPTGFEQSDVPPAARSGLIVRTQPQRVVLDTVPVRHAPPPDISPWRSGLLRPDRLHHTSFALASGLAVGLLTREPGAALGGALALGLFKELWDTRGGGGFDLVDLAADAIGAGASMVLTSGLLH